MQSTNRNPIPIPLVFLFPIFIHFTLIPHATCSITPVQLIGTYTKLPLPPLSPTCPDGIRILQVDPLQTNEGLFFVISHNNIQLLIQGSGFQTCTTTPVQAPRFGDKSATVLQRSDQITLDLSNPLVNAFNTAGEVFFLAQELGPRTCGQAVLPGGTVSMWVAPDTVITVSAGSYSINFKPGFKYIYYFSETDPCVFRGNANQTGSLQPVPTPPSPTPTSTSTQLLSPLPNPSQSPFPIGGTGGSTGSSNNPGLLDSGVTVEDGIQTPTPSSGPACFPCDAVVSTLRGDVVMCHLRVGDHVLIGRGRYSEVFGFTHAAKRVQADFVSIGTQNRTVVLSRGHYIHANGKTIKAEDVRRGDYIMDVELGETAVTNVEIVKKLGLYNPQTTHGLIVVDGIVVTTYTTALGEMMTAHALLTPIRMLRRSFPWWVVKTTSLVPVSRKHNMDQLHRDTRRVILEARNQLESLEAASTNTQLDPAASSAVSASFRENVLLLGNNASSLRALLSTQPPSRREVWKARLRDLDDQISELRAGDARCAARFRKIQSEKMMREELFQRRPVSDTGDAVLRMSLADEHRSLENSGSMVSNIISTGRGALQGLADQRGNLRKAKTKMLNVMHQIGVDRQIIRSIERREWSDTLLVYGLMAALLFLLGLAVIWKYHRKRHSG